MLEDLRQRYEKLVTHQDHIKIDIEKYENYQWDERMSYVDENGKEWLLESKENMDLAVQRWVEQFKKVDEENVFYIFGLGHTAYIRELRKKYPANVIIVYEPNEENVIRILYTEEFQSICEDEKIVLIAGEERKETLIRVLDATASYTNYKKILYAEIPNYHKIWECDYTEFHQCIKDKLEDNLVEKYTLVKQGVQRAQNQVYNLKSFFHEAGIADIKNAIDEKIVEQYPVVIVGAGPSLDKNIDVLREYQGRAFIICVESALNKLMSHGIVPDLNVAVDPSLGLGKKYAIKDEHCQTIPLLTDVECSWTYIDQFKGRKFYFALNADFYNHFLGENQVGYMGTGGSVAQNAFSLARYLNAKHIIFVGQDLAYPEGKIHADGVLNENLLQVDKDNKNYFYVDGIDGKPVLTEKIMDIYRKWYEDVLVLEKKWHVIDATEGGALIQGTEVMTLRNALETYCPEQPIDFRKLLDSAGYFFDEKRQEDTIKKIDAIYEHIEDKVHRFENARKTYQTLQNLNQKRMYNSIEFKQCIEKISKFTAEIEEDVELTLYRMYTNQKSFDLQENLGKREENIYEEIQKIAKNGIEIIDAYLLAAKKLKRDWEKFYMGKENIKLTISILISGNKETVKKCLDSISHLMQEVPTELILTDTGCSPEVRNLIEEYTDHIIDFTWCQDFSAARNAGLKEAKGQWFMYLDDDEWFENTTEIENFLLSEASDECDTAFYTQRNYLDAEGMTYVNHNVDRLIRIQPGLHFERRIHEAYSGVEIRKKQTINCFVHHYGYVYRNLEEKLKKHERNQKLLELECREHPEDMRMQYQAVINLFDVENWDGAIKRAYEAIQQESNSEYWDACHTAILYCYEQKKDYQQMVETGKMFLEKPLCEYDKFGALQFIINAYWEMKEYACIPPFAKSALVSYGMYKRNPDRYNQHQLMRTEFLQQERIYQLMAYAIFSGLICGDETLIQMVLSEELLPEVKALYGDEAHRQWIKNTTEIVVVDEQTKALVDRISGKLFMEEGIDQELEEDIKLLNKAEETLWLLRRGHSMRAGIAMSKFLSDLEGCIGTYAQMKGEDIVSLLGLPMLMEAQENEDEILIADVIEGQTIPVLEEVIQQKMEICDICETDYYIRNMVVLETCNKLNSLQNVLSQANPRKGCQYNLERTASGQPTMGVEENGKRYYISGNNNPYRDAHLFLEANVEEDKSQYVMLGAGLLYEAQVMLEERPDIELVVVEEDPYLLSMAFRCRDLRELLVNERFKLVVDSYMHFIGNLQEEAVVLIHKPSLRHIRMEAERETLEEFYVKKMTSKEQQGLLEWNFRKNIIRNENVVTSQCCKKDFQGKTVFLVAGGPSLDHGIEVLRYRSKDDIILCVGTSAKRLLEADIVPDYVIISDGGEQIASQLAGLEEYPSIKLLYLCTANAKAVALFQGGKYAVFQKGYDEAEAYAERKKIELVTTGGSVSTTAMDLCIRYGCSRMVCLGLDLAYTNNQSHATGTLSEIATNSKGGTYLVKSVDGKKVATIPSLNMFRKWIEQRIMNEQQVEFINISDGAYIDGMNNIATEKALNIFQ